MRHLLFSVLLLPRLVGAAPQCSHPPPDPGFTRDKYQGLWYEIGKIQTAGGAFFERNCVCTVLEVEYKTDNTGNGLAYNNCRDKSPTGPWTNATGYLTQQEVDGKYTESFAKFGPKVDYTVIMIGDDYAVEYDCGELLGGLTINYCLHIMSRRPTMDQDLFNSLVAKAEAMDLNPLHLPVKTTIQAGCW